jgi:hypothetical protein
VRVPPLVADRRAGLGPLHGSFAGRRSDVARVAGPPALKKDDMPIVD